MHTDGERTSWLWRRRWWLLVVVLIVALFVLEDHKPQRYLDEAAVMERIATLLRNPVAYERIEGWSWAPFVSHVYLPRVELDEDTTLQLASLLQQLPRVTLILCYYHHADDQEQIEQLRQKLPGQISVLEPGSRVVSSEDGESRQSQTYVAGIY